jgi:hypothetical protein
MQATGLQNDLYFVCSTVIVGGSRRPRSNDTVLHIGHICRCRIKPLGVSVRRELGRIGTLLRRTRPKRVARLCFLASNDVTEAFSISINGRIDCGPPPARPQLEPCLMSLAFCQRSNPAIHQRPSNCCR